MLQAIHDNLKGVFAMIILGALAVVFIFWGVEFVAVGGMTSAQGIEVNGEDVPVNDVQREYQEQLTQLQTQLRGMDVPDALREQLRKQVIERAVTSELVRQRTNELRFRATDSDVLEMLQQVPAFQVDGKFSKDAYYAALRSANIEPAYFEAQQKQAVAARQLDRGIYVSSFVLPAEFDRYEGLVNEMREVAWVVLPAERFVDDVTVDEAGLAAWYEQHREDYRSEERVNLQYVEIDLDGLAQSVNVDEAALRAFYEDNLQRYEAQERRRLRHILITADGDDAAAEAAAQAAYQRATAGEDFGKLAAELSQDPGSAAQGGDLGWQDRDALVKSFADAAWALQPGGISEPVRSEFGWHVIKLDEVEAGHTRSFEEARAELEPEYRRVESEKLFGDLQEQLDTEAFEAAGDLQRVAGSMALDVRSVDGFTRAGGGPLGRTPELIRVVFEPEVLNGSQLRTVEVAPGRVVALKVVAHEPPRDRPLEEVREQATAAYRAALAREAAGRRAAALAEELRAGASWREVAQPWIPAGAGQPTSAVLRFIRRDEAAVPPSVSAAAFTAPEPAGGAPVFGTAALGTGDAVVWTVTYVRPGSPAALSPAQRAQALRDARDRMALRDASAYVEQLRAGAEVKVNPQLLQ
jgi:peptidyl-prolyl cis-trans isomerase D